MRTPELDQIGAAAFERLNEARRGFWRRIAGGEIGDHAAAIFAFQCFKEPGDSRRHARSNSLKIFTIDIDIFVAGVRTG